MGDEGDAAVHGDRDAVLGQLLVAERFAVRAGGQRDGRVPQRKVHLVEAVDVNCPIRHALETQLLLFMK